MGVYTEEAYITFTTKEKTDKRNKIILGLWDEYANQYNILSNELIKAGIDKSLLDKLISSFSLLSAKISSK